MASTEVNDLIDRCYSIVRADGFIPIPQRPWWSLLLISHLRFSNKTLCFGTYVCEV